MKVGMFLKGEPSASHLQSSHAVWAFCVAAVSCISGRQLGPRTWVLYVAPHALLGYLRNIFLFCFVHSVYY